MRFFKISLLAIALSAVLPLMTHAADTASDWVKFEQAETNKLPKSAIAALEPIIAKTLADGTYDEALKAILLKAACATAIEGNDRSAQIQELRPYLDRVPSPLKPMLATALAHAWQNYYSQNRWQLLNRSASSGGDDSDFRTWDATRVLEEINRLYTLALSDTDRLKRTPIIAFNAVLEPGTIPDTYRPTLYDFLVHDAIAFYSLGEQGVSQPEDAFEPSADSPIFGTLEEFLAWKPATTDTNSPKLKAIKLYQDLLRFHKDDTLALALSDADLQRILWAGRILGSAENTDVRRQTALRQFITRWKNYETASNASAELAQWLMGADYVISRPLYRSRVSSPGSVGTDSNSNPLEAYKVATQGIALHPQSIGAQRCRAIILSLEAQELRAIQTESVWNAPWPDIEITHKNLASVTFRAVPANWNDYLDRNRNRPNSLNAKEFSALLKQVPAKTWTVALPKNDYAVSTFKTAAPTDLAPGFYFIIASANDQFAEKKNALAYTTVCVSNLALVYGKDEAARKNPQDNIQGFVLDAGTGDPIANATVTGWYRDSAGDRINFGETKTDSSGSFSINSKKYDSILLLAKTADGQMITNEGADYYYWGNYEKTPERTRQYIHFLTDRAIYRPGQAIQFKAVLYSANRDTDQYEILPGKRVIVAIDDPNGKEAARIECYANGFGSISGSFTIPPGRLNGQYAIHTVGAENGRGYVSVEEYKRPKFEVVLNAPAIAPKLDDTVTLEGIASAYTGAPIDGAMVKWTVNRTVRWPYWCWWLPRGSSRAIAHGTAATDASGKFKIEFTAAPDKTADPQNEPQFNYTVTAEITDNTGETRDASRSVTVGYTALQAIVSADDWQTSDQPVTLKISTTSLDGIPQKSGGTVMIYSLKQPAQILRGELKGDYGYYTNSSSEKNPADPRTWEEDAGVATERFATNDEGKATIAAKLTPGIYRAVLTTQDRFGKPVSARTEIRVNDISADKYPVREPFILAAEKWELQPGDNFTAIWGSGYPSARALVSIEHRGKIIQRFWTDPSRTQQKITLSVTEQLRGGFTLNIFQVRENRLYSENHTISVPWKNKDLKIAWERFNSKLVPGGRETWSLRIQKPDGTVAGAELAATLYDASLNQFRENYWNSLGGIFSYEFNRNWDYSLRFANTSRTAKIRINDINDRSSWPSFASRTYRNWLSRFWITRDGYNSRIRTSRNAMMADSSVMYSMAAPAAAAMPESAVAKAKAEAPRSADLLEAGENVAQEKPPSLDTVTARKNLQETAFFFPNLIAERDGAVRIEFTTPEALTRWRFLAFAHDKELRSGVFTDDTAVTSKDLMVQPNPPRFVREGDTVEFTVKVTNKTDKPQSGKIRLNLSDALSLDSADQRLGNGAPEREFSLGANASQAISWRINIPDGQGFLIYKAVGAAGLNSDGEEGYLPVLSRRQLVTESMPLPVRGAVTKVFRFGKLLDSGSDSTLRNESLTVQMVSNPAWYAVMALPYLMEYPYECSEQLFSRLYANALAVHIANSDPRIARVFEQWRNTPALDSPLFKNEDLKSVLISETPWVRAAESESAARRNIAILFDKNRTTSEITGTLNKLRERQLADGRWSWFPDGPASDYITRYIVSGFGKLRHLGVSIDTAPAMNALPALDTWLTRQLADIKESAAERKVNYLEEDHLSSFIAFHLYTRAFFLKDAPITAADQEAYNYFREQSRKYWTGQGRQSQGHLALALHRFDAADAIPAAIARSLKEHAKLDGELGMYWANEPHGWFWWQAPIETHALMIELFDEVAHDNAAVDDLQTWLLKQKQTQAWNSTKSTSDAVYALLLRGTDKLASDKIVTVSLADQVIQPKHVEPGTGFYSERIAGATVKPEMGKITVQKTDDGVAWGSVTWQYFQNIEKITPHEGTPLKLKKTLWKRITTKSGEELIPVPQNKIHVGDTIIVRIELRVDRDMEFVHLKDQRGSGTEPVNVLSGYRWKDGLGHYESTGDTATHFFIDWLRKGTYVFEYPVRIQLRGTYQSGIAEIQCMYAPEFNSHSESIRMVVE